MAIKPSQYIDLQPFRAWVQQTLPAIYDDSLSYTDLLSKMLDYMNCLVSNNNNLIKDFKLLYDYVNSLTDDKHFEELLKNVLDQMVIDGTLKMPEIPLEITVDNNHKMFYDVKNCAIDSTNNICDTTNRNSDITMKPYISSGSLAFYDEKGNLLELGCGDYPFFPISELVSSKDGLGKIVQQVGNSTRYANGVQISKGQSTFTVAINIANGSLFQNKNHLDTPIGFTKSFSEKPLLFVSIDGANSYWISGVNKNQNGITGIRIQSATQINSTDIKVDWIAIGRWSA